MLKKQTPKRTNQAVKSKPIAKAAKTKNVKTVARPKPVTAAQSNSKNPAKNAPPAKVSPRERKFREIKKKLLAQRKSLLMGALDALNELPGPTVFPDLGDQATAEMDRNFMLRLRGRERKLLKKIDEAIDRIDQNVFGICDRCGDEIDIRRLDARPVTTMCIDCKILEEEEEKLRKS